jgi:hypothetical protein
MAMHFGGRYTSVSQITGPSGFYNIKVGNDNVVVYVDQEYDGGGWVCVMANRQGNGGMNNLTYYDAINTCNYRSSSSTTPAPLYNLSGLSNYNIWIGTKYWEVLGKRNNSSYVTVTQFVAPTNGTPLSGSHTKRYRWKFDNFTPTFAFSGVGALSDETSTGAPGFYNNHAAGGYNLSSYDNDQDTNGGSCSSYYNNNPWWYESCWSGNYFAGGGYVDAPYWVGSGGDYHQYGAVYIK